MAVSILFTCLGTVVVMCLSATMHSTTEGRVHAVRSAETELVIGQSPNGRINEKDYLKLEVGVACVDDKAVGSSTRRT